MNKYNRTHWSKIQEIHQIIFFKFKMRPQLEMIILLKINNQMIIIYCYNSEYLSLNKESSFWKSKKYK